MRVLENCRLKHLQRWLDTSANWSHRLSPGEQQRLAFARALLIRPSILFLDEATSALDDETEQLMYCLLVDELPDVTLISVAHRNSVAKYHQTCWRFSRSEDQPARGAEPAAGITRRPTAFVQMPSVCTSSHFTRRRSCHRLVRPRLPHASATSRNSSGSTRRAPASFPPPAAY